jgi:hypothetical protein
LTSCYAMSDQSISELNCQILQFLAGERSRRWSK